jgi:hypothetical protein
MPKETSTIYSNLTIGSFIAPVIGGVSTAGGVRRAYYWEARHDYFPEYHGRAHTKAAFIGSCIFGGSYATQLVAKQYFATNLFEPSDALVHGAIGGSFYLASFHASKYYYIESQACKRWTQRNFNTYMMVNGLEWRDYRNIKTDSLKAGIAGCLFAALPTITKSIYDIRLSKSGCSFFDRGTDRTLKQEPKPKVQCSA